MLAVARALGLLPGKPGHPTRYLIVQTHRAEQPQGAIVIAASWHMGSRAACTALHM